ncbi:MAG: T9SS type A sorting domain-containing protein [Bacteroidota bacterium]
MTPHLLRTLALSIGLWLMSCLSLQAQWVSIPDGNFVDFLTTSYPQCMNGNQMDTTCPGIVNDTVIDCGLNGIYDLTGISYFDSLKVLYCYQNNLTSLPPLPTGLIHLNCDINYQLVLTDLPNSLQILNCWALTNNNMDTLPTLPPGLKYLNCGYWGLGLTSLPVLPAGLEVLSCTNNKLDSLPALPATLKSLNCGSNLLTNLPQLPAGLNGLFVSHNLLTNLPLLPDSLESLNFLNNQISSIPALPPRLTFFNCSKNLLTNLPALPGGITSFDCSYNQLVSLPELPDSLNKCYINNNPLLQCLPQLKRIVDLKLGSTNIACLPNYGNITTSMPALSWYPLCDVLNQNGCEVFWNISGRVYFDADADCLADIDERSIINLPVRLWRNSALLQQTNGFAGGSYSFETNTGSYQVNIDTTGFPFYVSCPASGTYHETITNTDTIHYSRNFGLQCKPGFDLEAHSIVADRFRPANITTTYVRAGDATNFYGAHCAAGTSGAVTVTYSGAITYVSPSSGALIPTVSGNVLTYNIADFGAVNFLNDFNIIVQTDTNAVLGSQVCFTVSVTPTVGDNNPANNTLTHCFTVVGSYDPNDKQVYPLSDVDVNGEQWLTYTVNFQNTGTDTAIHIYITDTLDADLDASTFQLLAYSHQPMVQLKENAVRFNFPNIMLVDSHANEPLSHGYVQYKIKIKDNKPVGTVINNTAFIYFDFNAPVVTNTTTNTIAVISSVGEVRNQKSEIRIYPNPASNSVTISVDEVMLGSIATITDITGRKMMDVQLTTRNLQLETTTFASGVYFVTVSNEKESVTKKLIIHK